MNIKRQYFIAAIASILSLGGYTGLSAWNSRPTPAKIAAGQSLFEHEWTVNDPLCGEGDGLGPVFNATSCAACHFQGGLGGSSGNALNVTAFEVEFDNDRTDHPTGVVHAKATSTVAFESKARVRQIYPAEMRIAIAWEAAEQVGCEYMPPKERTVSERHDPVIFHQLNSPALFGAGLIDEISNLSINFQGHKRLASRISNEMSGDFSGNRLGMVNAVGSGVGKFGWKGQFATLEDFVASACAMEIGLTNSSYSQQIANDHCPDQAAKKDMTRKQLHELVCFVRSLPRPEQIMPMDPRAVTRVTRGEEVFSEIGCADCHVPDLGGVEGIYSDFHLYNLEPIQRNAGKGYSDGKAEEEFDFNRDHPHPDQWQTPALWGVADSAPYFHDGGAMTLRDAIERHQGQGDFSRTSFQVLSKLDQGCLLEFLGSLKAPVVAAVESNIAAN